MGFNPFEDEWDPQAALASLVEERDVLDGGDGSATAKRLLQQNLPAATASIIHTALHSPNEHLRLDASKTILDRCLGTVAQVDPLGRVEDPLETTLKQIFEHALSNNPESGSVES